MRPSLIQTVAIVLLLAVPAVANAQEYALRFLGGTLVFPHDPIMNTGGAATIEAWVAVEPTASGVIRINERYLGAAEHKNFHVASTGNLRATYAWPIWPEADTGPGIVPADEKWHHVAFVLSGLNYLIFLDGLVVMSGTGSGNVINASTTTNFGFGSGFRLRTARTSSVARYTGPFVPADAWTSDASTAMLLQLDEGVGTTVYDSGPAAQVGTLTGGFEWVPACGLCRLYGTGCAGSGGYVPVLMGDCVGTPGMLELRIDQGYGGALSLLFVGGKVALPTASGCTLLVLPLPSPVIPIPLGGSGNGAGSATLPLSLPTGLPSFEVSLQGFVWDPAVPHGYSATNGLTLAIE